MSCFIGKKSFKEAVLQMLKKEEKILNLTVNMFSGEIYYYWPLIS